MKELIGVIGGRSGDSITDELHKRDKKVVLVAGSANEPGADKADIVIKKDLRFKEEIYKDFEKNNVSKVIIATGHILAIELAEYLKKQGIYISIDTELSKLCKDKFVFKKYIEDKGFITPKYEYINKNYVYNIESIIKKIGLPCVLKSTIDVVQPQLIHEKEILISQIDKIIELDSDVLIEEYIDGNDCTVPIYSDGRDIHDLGILYYSKAKEYKLEGFNNARSDRMDESLEKEIVHISNRLAKAIDMVGLSRIDFIVKEKNIYILEINSVIVTGYTGSAYPFFKEKGINIADIAVKTALSIMR